MHGGKGRILQQEERGLWREMDLGLSWHLKEVQLPCRVATLEGTVLIWSHILKKYFVSGGFYLLLVSFWWGYGGGANPGG